LPNCAGTEYFIKELGPYITSKARIVEACNGCGAEIDQSEYCFWHPRELFFVDCHFCQLCVAYVLYHLQIKKEKPAKPFDAQFALEQCLRAKYPQFFARRFPPGAIV